ncbi:MAG: glycoside hydrolase family 11 protein [Lachnospiraceae bacterium]|nr:glycoside hydrolase family 11 protein [Lachnospiraceae bacterium]MDE7183993.1 glycoside hydrolase family 11 protein [Lachnospiraceae bacterium]
MNKRLRGMLLPVLMCALLMSSVFEAQAAQTIYDNDIGIQDDYNYELWKDYGTTSMTLNGGGTFTCQWSDINNALFRKGKKFDMTRSFQQIGKISIDYGCNYQPNGNSYLCAYGWCVDPLVEYYIVESWGTWRPPGAEAKGTIEVDGGTYDVYETTRVDQPSIQGDVTFKQYWSVRTERRTSGIISVTDHFKAWERMGMPMGKLYETALNIEGYQSSGWADVYQNIFRIEECSDNGVKVECEDMLLSGNYAGKIETPFDGAGLYANGDSCRYTRYFTDNRHCFTLRGCSNNANMAEVDLLIGGEYKGTFYFGDAYPAEYTISDVYHGTGSQIIELKVTSDNGLWDAYVDYLRIG